MDLQRLIYFMMKLAASGMSEEDITARGYDFALTYLLSEAELTTRKDKEISHTTKLELMERASGIITNATGLLKIDRQSLDNIKYASGNTSTGSIT